MATAKLTTREVEVLTGIASGLDSKQVADSLFISKRTVDFHLANIYAKLTTPEVLIKNRLQAINRARALGLLAA